MENIKLNTGERGSVIVEATFVFPVMFIILFILIYMGNAFVQKAQIEGIVTEYAIKGANYCTDPILTEIKEQGKPPAYNALDAKPYRYLFGGMSYVETDIEAEVVNAINNSFTFFAGMSPDIKTPQNQIATFNNAVVYSTFSVEVDYAIKFPISFLGGDRPIELKLTARGEAPVSDTAEFIRNTDLVIDVFHGTKIGQSISDVFGKINDFISSFASK